MVLLENSIINGLLDTRKYALLDEYFEENILQKWPLQILVSINPTELKIGNVTCVKTFVNSEQYIVVCE